MKRVAFAVMSFFALGGVALAAPAAPNPSAPASSAAAPAPHARHAGAMGAGLNDASARRMTEALNLLESKGYGAFKDFHADGMKYDATVSQGSQSFAVTVDPDAGSVTRTS